MSDRSLILCKNSFFTHDFFNFKVELELGLDTENPTYCLPRGEQIAYAVDEAAPSSKKDQPKPKYYPRFVNYIFFLLLNLASKTWNSDDV